MPSEVAALLQKLSDIPGVSGDESSVRDAIWGLVEAHVDEAWIDSMGSLICRKGKGKPRILLDAHMDEVGLIVTRVNKEGYVHFDKVGGLDDRILTGTEVCIGPNQVPGVIGTRPIHLEKDRDKAIDADKLVIDVGRDAERLVHPGDYATFATTCEPFGDGLWKGKALDDRAGCAILIALIQRDLRIPLYFSFSVQEEVGLRGAGPVAFAADVDVALAVEGTTCADVPGVEPEGEATRLGGGPVITAMDGGLIVSPFVLDRLRATGVPFQWKRTTAGGTNAGRLHLARGGCATGVVAVPCRYIHGPAALLAESDLLGALELVQAFVRGLAAKT